jgi:hypothetical protein
MKKYFVLFIFCCISCAYNIKKDTNEKNKEQLSSLIYIKIEKPDIASLSCLRLSEFADSVEYVQLETTQECLLPYYIGGRTFVTGNLLFIMDLFYIYQFDIQTGKFLRSIGRVGQGPGEYLQVNAVIDTIDRKIVVKSPGKTGLMMYDYEGKYLGNMPMYDGQDSPFTTCFYSLALSGIIDDCFVFSINDFLPANQVCHLYELIVYDYKNKKILHSLPNRLEGNYEKCTREINGLRTTVKADDILFYKSFYNDTLYTANKTGINPYAIIDLGSRKYSVSAILSRNPSFDAVGKILINGMYIQRENIYLECMLLKEDRGNADFFICKYNLTTHKLTCHSSIIINDLDGGSNINIKFLASTLPIIPVTPSDVIDGDRKKKIYSTLDKSELKYPELKDKFDNMQANRNPDDNPLLMILHKKK